MIYPQFKTDVSLSPPVTMAQVHAVLPALTPEQLHWANDWIHDHSEDSGATVDFLVDSIWGLSEDALAFAKWRIYGPFTITQAEEILPNLDAHQRSLVHWMVRHNRFLMESSRNKVIPRLITIDLLVSGVAGLTDAERARARSRIRGFEHLWDPFGEYPYVSLDGLIQASKLLRDRKCLHYWLPDIMPVFFKGSPVMFPKSRRAARQDSHRSVLLTPSASPMPLKGRKSGSTWKRFSRWSYVCKEQVGDTDVQPQMYSV